MVPNSSEDLVPFIDEDYNSSTFDGDTLDIIERQLILLPGR
jgi:hypothetical protein